MKRNDDLIREILLRAEGTAANREPDMTFPSEMRDEVLEHLELLIEADILEGRIIPNGMGEERLLVVDIERMTWKGHEFLESIRNDQVWAKLKKWVADKGGSVSFEILKTMASRMAQDYFLGPDPGS